MRHATVAASAEVARIISDACRTLEVLPDKLTIKLIGEYSQRKCDDMVLFHTAAKEKLSVENGVISAYLEDKRSDRSARRYNAVARFEAISGELKNMKKEMLNNEILVHTEIARLKAEFEAFCKYNTMIASEIENHANYSKEIELIEAAREEMVAEIAQKLVLMQADINAAKIDFEAARTSMYYNHNVLISSVESRDRALYMTHARNNKPRRVDDDSVVYG